MPNGLIIRVIKDIALVSHKFINRNPEPGDRINEVEDLEFERGGKAWLSAPAPDMRRVVVKRKRNGKLRKRPRSAFERDNKSIGIIGLADLQDIFNEDRELLSIGPEIVLSFQPDFFSRLAEFSLTYEHDGDTVEPIILSKDETNSRLVLTADAVFGPIDPETEKRPRDQEATDNFQLKITGSNGASVSVPIDPDDPTGDTVDFLSIGGIEFYTEEEVAAHLKEVYDDYLRMMKKVNAEAIRFMEDVEGYVHPDVQQWLTEHLGMFDPGDLPPGKEKQGEQFKVMKATGFHERAEQGSRVILRFQEGNIVNILEKPDPSIPENGWWQAEFEGLIGWVKHTVERLEKV